MFVLGIILIVAAVLWGGYANAYWKGSDKGDQYANGFMRALIGIPAWGVLICLMMEQWTGVAGCLAAVLVLMIPALLKLFKSEYNVPKVCLYIVGASMGAYSRILMAWTLIGIPINMMLTELAEKGWKGQMARIEQSMRKRMALQEKYEREHADEIAWNNAVQEMIDESIARKMQEEREYRCRVAIENGRNYFEDPETGKTRWYDESSGEWK